MLPLKTIATISTHPELVKLLAYFNKSQMQLSTKVVSQSPIIVMEPKVGRAHLTDSQFLLLEA